MRSVCGLGILLFGCSDGKIGVFASGGSPSEAGVDLAAWSSCEAKPLESTGNDTLVQTVPPPLARTSVQPHPSWAFWGPARV